MRYLLSYNLPARSHSKFLTPYQTKNEWGAELICSHWSPNARGVAILITKILDCVVHSQIVDTLGRYIIVKAAIKEKIYVLVSVYAPNKDDDIIKFLTNVLTICTTTCTKKQMCEMNVKDYAKTKFY